MENYFGYVLFALGIVIMFLLHYKKGMKWKWSIILGYTAFAFMMTIFMGAMDGTTDGLFQVFLMILAMPLILLFMLFFAIGAVLDLPSILSPGSMIGEIDLKQIFKETLGKSLYVPNPPMLLDDARYDFLRNDPHLGYRICYLTLGGSKAYGTDTPESDTHIRGVAHERAEQNNEDASIEH